MQKLMVIYKPYLGKERIEFFDVEFWCDEFIRELNKQSLIVYTKKEIYQ